MNSFAALLAEADSGFFSFLHTMRGPHFLLLYAVWFLITYGGVLLLRWREHDTQGTTLAGLLCFELLAVARIIDGLAHGMHNWVFLIFMMVIGGIIFLIRTEHFQNTGSNGGGGWWSSCSGGSCGGGGGCGGS